MTSNAIREQGRARQNAVAMGSDNSPVDAFDQAKIISVNDEPLHLFSLDSLVPMLA